MALYSYYDPNQAAAEAQARRDAALARLQELAGARQRFTDEMFARQEEERRKMLEEQARLERRQQDFAESSLDEAASGAQMGFQAGGPWGALIGGALGNIIGQVKAHGARKDKGAKNWLRTLGELATGGLIAPIEQAAKGRGDVLIDSGMRAAGMGAGLAGKAIQNRMDQNNAVAANEAKWRSQGFGSQWAEEGMREASQARRAQGFEPQQPINRPGELDYFSKLYRTA